MDKTVRLWHISRRECLCCFQHIDFVTAIAFHPRVSVKMLFVILMRKVRGPKTINSRIVYSNLMFHSALEIRKELNIVLICIRRTGNIIV